MLVKSDIANLLDAGMKEEFMNQYEQAETKYENVATTINSGKSQETYPWLGNVSGMKEWKDERVPEGLYEHDFSITNRDWEDTIAVDRNAIEDEQYGQIKTRVRQLADEASRFWDEMVFTLLGQANSTSGSGIFDGVDITAYDGKAFLASDHEEGESGTQSNYSSSNSLNTSNLQSAITSMRSFKDDQGNPARIDPDTLVVPPELEFTAREILNSTYYPEEGSTTAKVSKNVLQGALNLVVSPYISTSDAWFVLDTSRVVKPIILQLRKEPEFSSLTEGTESEFLRKKLYFGVDWRGEAAFGDWRTVYGSFPSA